MTPKSISTKIIYKNIMAKQTNDPIGTFVDQCVTEFTRLGYTTQKQVYKHVYDLLHHDYDGKVPKERIDSVVDDVVESVCLKVNYL